MAGDVVNMLQFRRLAPHEIPWQQLDAFGDRVVFQTREWLSFVGESQNAKPLVAEIHDGKILAGYFQAWSTQARFADSRQLLSGLDHPYIGFNLLPEYSRSQMLEPLAAWAFRDLGCVHLEVSDRCFSSSDGEPARLDQTAYESYKSDLTRSEDDLFKGMDSACRRCIRKAEKSGVVVEEARDDEFADEYYEQLKDVFAKQGKVPTYTVDRVRVLLKHMLPTGRLLAVRARNPEGRCIATGLCPGMNDIAFFWGNASWRSEQQWRPNEYLHWYALRYWKARGVKTFDWGGGGTYKEKYGVVPHTVPWFYKSKYRLLTTIRNEARTLFYRSQGLIDRLHGVQPAPAPAASE